MVQLGKPSPRRVRKLAQLPQPGAEPSGIEPMLEEATKVGRAGNWPWGSRGPFRRAFDDTAS